MFVLLVNLLLHRQVEYCKARSKMRITLVASISFEPHNTSPSQTPVVKTFKGPMTTLVVTESNRQWPNDD
jgi:hypothetical protein